MEFDLKEFIHRVKDNMKKCNVGELYGVIYESGYRAGVGDVVEMLEEYLKDE